MTDKKELKINFAPGCFDNFEGTQEELDALIADIQKMFEGKTAEELEAMSRPLDDDDFEELPEEVVEQLMNSFNNSEKRNLQ